MGLKRGICRKRRDCHGQNPIEECETPKIARHLHSGDSHVRRTAHINGSSKQVLQFDTLYPRREGRALCT